MRTGAASAAGALAALALAVGLAATGPADGLAPPGPAASAASAASASSGVADRTASGGGRRDQARDEAVRRFFMTDGDWLRRGLGGPNFSGRVYCGLSVFGSSPDESRLYLWVFCQEYYRAGVAGAGEEGGPATGPVAEGTGVSAPVLVVVSGRGARTVVRDWRMPADGSGYEPSLREMFPAEVLRQALAGSVDVVPSPQELRAQATEGLAG